MVGAPVGPYGLPYMIDSEVPREQNMLMGHPPRVIYHQVYQFTKTTTQA